MFAIETGALTKSYGQKTIISNLNLNVPAGCVYGFLGPNGAGKTTTMRLLLGLLKPDSGTIRLVGHDIAKARRKALAQVGAFVESASVYDHLSGHSALAVTCCMLNLPKTEIDRVLDIVNLRKVAHARAGTYSLGMKQRLALARALLGTPKLLILDEPTNGLDPDGIIAMRDLIRDLPERISGTVFVSSHMLSEVEQIAEHAGIMREGRLIIQDRVTTLLGSGSTVSITLDNAANATTLLTAYGMTVETHGETKLRLTCAPGKTAEQAALANRLLVEAGFDVSALFPQTRSLEDVYRDTLTAPQQESLTT